MGERDFKFGRLVGTSAKVPHVYPESWALERTAGPNRLVITKGGQYVNLLRELSQVMDEPFGILYVLVVPRGHNAAGRYQSPYPISRQDLLGFLNRFERFLESDGRHNFWIASVGEPDLIVYDRHNLIYAYGRLESFKKILNANAVAEIPQVKIPSPHVHRYHEEYDADQQRLLGFWKWTHTPLRDQDED